MSADELADYHRSKALLATMLAGRFDGQDGTLFTLVQAALRIISRLEQAVADDDNSVARLRAAHARLATGGSTVAGSNDAQARAWLSALRTVVLAAGQADLDSARDWTDPVGEPQITMMSFLPDLSAEAIDGARVVLPVDGSALLVRTDFRDKASWQQLCQRARDPSEEGFMANFQPMSDRSFDGASWETVKAAVRPDDHRAAILLIADALTLSTADQPILVVDLSDAEGEQRAPFRCIPAQLWAVENNLNIANMDWEDFASATDDDRVFRGF